MSDRENQAKQFLAQVQGDSSRGLESFLDSSENVESLAERARLPTENRETVRRTLQKVASNAKLSAPEQFALEAIIIPDRRPAIDIVGGDFTVRHPDWLHFGTGRLKSNLKKALPSFGRVEVSGIPGLPYGGSGFVVGPQLLMTNRHVAELFTAGIGRQGLVFRPGLQAGVDFKRERGRTDSQHLRIRRIVMVHPYWDMALLAVDGLTDRNPPLFLSVERPEQLQGREIAVIGYPGFDPSHPTDVQNHVFGGVYYVKRLMPGKIGGRRNIGSFGRTISALTQDASTLPGASGSGVIDPVTGDIVALHFAGAYLDANFTVPAWELARDQRVVDAGVNFRSPSQANAAASSQWWGALEQSATPDPLPALGSPASRAPGFSEKVTWTIPIQVTVQVGGGAILATAAGPAGIAASDVATERAVQPVHDSDYSTRDGYSSGFLGIEVPPPEPIDEELCARQSNGEYLLHYHHFSLAMHRERRLALFTAANLDAAPRRKRPESGKSYSRKALGGLGPNDQERWFADPRLDAQSQLPDRFFTRDRGAFDRGHVVRREDVAWGDSYQEVRFANGDTFHTTNCTPQVAGFNQAASSENWGDLENYVTSQVRTDQLAIFAGPVLDEADPVFAGEDDDGPVRVQIPRQYWKVIVARERGELLAFAFVLRQDLRGVPLEFAVNAAWRGHMVTVEALESLLGNVRFPPEVHQADQAGNALGEAVRIEGDLELLA
jgi:endonuclease G, mitochondrial